MTNIVHKSDTRGGGFPFVCFMLLVVGTAWAADADMELERALHREIVLGDLKGAMEQYQAVLAEPGAAKSAQARALLGLAKCEEKLGQRGEARATYAKLANQGGSVEAGVARQKLADWEGSFPGPRNLKFAQGAARKAPPDWHVPGLPREADAWAQVRRGGCRGDGPCAVMLTPENAAIRAGGLDQSFKAALYRGKTLRLKAWVRLEAGARKITPGCI